MKKKIIKAVFLALYSIAIIEVAIRLILLIDPIFVRILDFDSASERLRWVKRHEDVDILYDYETHSPTLGWALRPNLRNESVIEGKILNTNSRGLRGIREYEDAKTGQRIVVLGDSFTFGLDVADDETYAQRLEQLLPGTEVLNLGVPGYGHDQMLLYFQEEGLKYQPDIVIIGFVHLDMQRNMMHFKNFAKPQFKLDRNNELYLTHVPVPTPEDVLQKEVFRFKTVDLLSILAHKMLWLSGRQEQRMNALTTAILDELIMTVKGAGATPVLVYLPLSLHKESQEGYFTWYCQQRDVACLSLQERFSETIASDAEFRSYTNHWQPPVHQIAAEGIKAFLLEQGILAEPDLQVTDSVPAGGE